jgi:hypothetical protein
MDAGALIHAYSKRCQLELFHRVTKHQFSLLNADVEYFDALTPHIQWVYCAYLLLHELEVPDGKKANGKAKKAHTPCQQRTLGGSLV